MPKISVIVPVYNSEDYLNKCIDSILNQTFTDFELILVDDGSTDKSGDICNIYSGKDNRIKVIHKENQGQSVARNIGIDMSKGEFIGFIDSDDYIENDMYETLYNDIITTNSDISICGMYDTYGKKNIKNKFNIKQCILDPITAFKLVLESKIISVSPVNKLYKRSLFNNKRYPEGKTYEDAFLTPLLLLEANSISYTPEHKYYYVHRERSTTTETFKLSDLSIIEAYKYHLDFVKEKIPELQSLALFRYLWAHMVVLDKIMRTEDFSDCETYNKILNTIKFNIFKILKNPLFTYKRKLSSLALMVNPNLYRKLVIKDANRKFNI